MNSVRSKLLLTVCFSVLAVLVVGQAKSETGQKSGTIFDERTWTDASGAQTFLGTLTKLENGIVTIEKDGDPLTFSVEKLSASDNEFLGQGVAVTTLDGTEHTDAFVTRIEPDSISFRKASGFATVKMENLPPAFAERFGYDLELVAAQRAQMEEAALKAAVRNKAGFALLPEQEKAIIINVKSQGATDAVIKIKDDSINLAFSVLHGTSEDEAKKIGDNFLRLVMSLSNDESPAADLPRGKFSYMIGALTPDQKWLVMGHKRKGVPKIAW